MTPVSQEMHCQLLPMKRGFAPSFGHILVIDLENVIWYLEGLPSRTSAHRNAFTCQNIFVPEGEAYSEDCGACGRSLRTLARNSVLCHSAISLFGVSKIMQPAARPWISMTMFEGRRIIPRRDPMSTLFNWKLHLKVFVLCIEGDIDWPAVQVCTHIWSSPLLIVL